MNETPVPVLGFIGGCHVAGYLVEDVSSFVDHLGVLFPASEIPKVPYATIKKIGKHIDLTRKLQSDYIFMQLGNFEFSASWKQIIASTIGGISKLPFFASQHSSQKQKCFGTPPDSSSATTNPCVSAEAPVSPLRPNKAASSFLNMMKVGVGSALYFTAWVLLRKYRRQFNLINKLIQQNPQTVFVCISPFPVVAWTHNLLRRLGGFILRQRFHAQPNLRWLDSHQILQRKHAFLADGIHLNEEGHKVLAEHLYALCQTYAKTTKKDS